MRSRRRLVLLTIATALACGLLACGRPAPDGARSTDPRLAQATGRYGDVDAARLAAADREPGNWFMNGSDASGDYYSPLAQINEGNVARLGLAWQYDLGTRRGQEATPIVVDGVMYAVGNWGRVYALDAARGTLLWYYDPEVDGQYGRYACCDVVQRGLAVWQGVVYSGSTDAFLHAIDARTGKRLWKVDTLPRAARETHQQYTSSGSPVIAGDVVVIGNSGADLGVRGFFSAFDLKSGRLSWRFYTVPRDPKAGPQESPALERALATWDPDGTWKTIGGGGTVWDAMAYDAKRDLLYVGTGNSSPVSREDRSPKGGDNLYLACILAIRPKTGELVWYYQQVPGESWDYNANQKMILATLPIGGRPRDVLLQAPKNGLFYVLDRDTGEKLAAFPIGRVTWMDGFDATGRPKMSPSADYTTGAKLIFPAPTGVHTWHPMARDPRSGLVYVPTFEMPFILFTLKGRPIPWIDVQTSVGGMPYEYYDPAAMKADYGDLPPRAELAGDTPTEALQTFATLKAIDPLTGAVRWSHRTAHREGGVTATAGNLVFQGSTDGTLRVFAADTGRLLKEIQTGTSLMAAPAVYAVNGRQYVAIQAGLGGGLYFSFPKDSAAYRYGNANRILVFALDGGAVPLPPPVEYGPIPEPPPSQATPAQITNGRRKFTAHCSRCHAMGPGLVPDLRRLSPAMHAQFNAVVLRGLLAPNGMGRFDDVLIERDADDIHAYLIDVARAARRDGQDGATPVVRPMQ